MLDIETHFFFFFSFTFNEYVWPAFTTMCRILRFTQSSNSNRYSLDVDYYFIRVWYLLVILPHGLILFPLIISLEFLVLTLFLLLFHSQWFHHICFSSLFLVTSPRSYLTMWNVLWTKNTKNTLISSVANAQKESF